MSGLDNLYENKCRASIELKEIVYNTKWTDEEQPKLLNGKPNSNIRLEIIDYKRSATQYPLDK